MIKSLFFLTFIVFLSACATTQISQKEAYSAESIDYIDCSTCDDGNPCTTDYCTSNNGKLECSHENIICHSSERMCSDNYVAKCDNFCDNGLCSNCEPSCEGRECKEISKKCQDGITAVCREEYKNGSCISCEPKCACTPNYSCSDWGQCVGGFHTRICVDKNKCAPDKKETNDCSAIERPEEMPTQTIPQIQQSQSSSINFIEVMYDPAGEETKEEYIVLSGNGDLTGWSISDNSGTWKFPEGIVINGKIIVARNSDTFSSIYGCSSIGGFTRGLNNDGDQLTLKDKDGNQKDFVAWEKGASNAYPEWTTKADEGNVLRKNGDWHEAQPSPC